MIGRITLALAVVAALATAALVRPPRATPAFSFATVAPTPTAGWGRHHSSRKRRVHVHSKSHRPAPPHDVDLNRVDAATLARIPGVGEQLARRIVAYRELVGPFESLEDLDDLDGMSANRLDTLGRYLVVR